MIDLALSHAGNSATPGLADEVARLLAAPSGIVVAGELQSAADAAAARQISAALGWPLVADILSGKHAISKRVAHSRTGFLGIQGSCCRDCRGLDAS